MPLPQFHIVHAIIHRPDGPGRDPLGVSEGLLFDHPLGRAVHLPGWDVRPGIIDVHGDGFERHLATRRGALRDLSAGFGSLDTELAANGITTANLAQFYSWEGGMRGPDFASRMLESLTDTRRRLASDLKVQLRVEMGLFDEFDKIETLINKHDIRYVVFNDHLPHDALAKGKRPARLTGQALKSGRSPEAHLALLQSLHAKQKDMAVAVTEFAKKLASQDILTGSHDDADAATRTAAWAQGLIVSEFPETFSAAKVAKDQGVPIVMGAPNVVRGGSHQGRVSAQDLVRDGMCTAIASDYHYPALFQAVQVLAGDIGSNRAWDLLTKGPAQMLGLHDRGALISGLRADLLAINPATGRVGLTVTGGRVAYADPDAAEALLMAR